VEFVHLDHPHGVTPRSRREGRRPSPPPCAAR
jgi:hypothetical protein